MDTLLSKAVIDACWPTEWRDRADSVAQLSQELRKGLIQKWGDQLFS